VDPVCGMTVEPSSAAAAWEHEGTTYYFCSVGCFDRFRTDPEHFLSLPPDERAMDD
jgi:Cu+-exporting ATPase